VSIYNNSTTILHLYSIEPPPPLGGAYSKNGVYISVYIGEQIGVYMDIDIIQHITPSHFMI